jgi:type III pantothenate kinase
MNPQNFLAFDIGNTNMTIGLLQNGLIQKVWRLSTRQQITDDELTIQLAALLQINGLGNAEWFGAAICSVCPPLDNRCKRVLTQLLKIEPVLLKPDAKLPFTNAYDAPKDVGMDRLANVAAALLVAEAPVIIIDFGTATTLDVLDTKQNYLGGVIMAGIETTADALFQKTSKLPQIPIEVPPSAIGRNTIHAIQSGLLLGTIESINGMVRRLEAELGTPTKIIVTGGLGQLLNNQIDRVFLMDEHLTLKGIRVLWDYQRTV